MRQKAGTKRNYGEKVVKDIHRTTRKQYSAEEKIRIVLDGLYVRQLCCALLVGYRAVGSYLAGFDERYEK